MYSGGTSLYIEWENGDLRLKIMSIIILYQSLYSNYISDDLKYISIRILSGFYFSPESTRHKVLSVDSFNSVRLI